MVDIIKQNYKKILSVHTLHNINRMQAMVAHNLYILYQGRSRISICSGEKVQDKAKESINSNHNLRVQWYPVGFYTSVIGLYKIT